MRAVVKTSLDEEEGTDEDDDDDDAKIIDSKNKKIQFRLNKKNQRTHRQNSKLLIIAKS